MSVPSSVAIEKFSKMARWEDDRFKKIAYSKAIKVLKEHETITPELIMALRHAGTGIGKGMEEKLTQILNTGTFAKYEALKASHPDDKINDEEWKIKTFKAVKRIPYKQAIEKVLPVIKALKPYCKKIEIAGSLRRKTDLVADADILILADITQWTKIISIFSEMASIIKQGDSKIEAIVGETKTLGKNGNLTLVEEFQVDLTRVEKSWGTALLHYTGSKIFNIKCRSEAIKLGYSLNQYGITTEKGLKEFDTEKEALEFIGLSYISPEER